MNSVYNEDQTNARADAGARIAGVIDRVGRFLGRIGFGLFLLLAVGATLVATTFVGILLALAAGFLAFTQKLGRRRRRAASSAEAEQGPPPTLEAHRTADGWITEPVGRD